MAAPISVKELQNAFHKRRQHIADNLE